jgi:hypothetical protein
LPLSERSGERKGEGRKIAACKASEQTAQGIALGFYVFRRIFAL